MQDLTQDNTSRTTAANKGFAKANEWRMSSTNE